MDIYEKLFIPQRKVKAKRGSPMKPPEKVLSLESSQSSIVGLPGGGGPATPRSGRSRWVVDFWYIVELLMDLDQWI